MKKLIAVFIIALCACAANAQSSLDSLKEFATVMNNEARDVEQSIESMTGVKSKFICRFDEPNKEIVMEYIFDVKNWQYFDAEAARNTTFSSYASSYKNNPDFASFIGEMADRGFNLHLIYSCFDDGEYKTKHAYITPFDIINDGVEIIAVPFN